MKGVLLLSSLLVLASANASSAASINFEDAYSDLDYRGKPSNYYSGDGLTIDGNYFGLLGGVSQGDPGNFDLEGTNGPSSLAVNTIGHNIDLIFNSAVDLDLDLGTSFGRESNVTVNTYLNGVQLTNSLDTFSDTLNNGLGTWTALSWEGIDRVSLEATGGWRAWSIDNLQFNNASVEEREVVPEPTSIISFLGLGLTGIVFSGKKRKRAV